jgi:hypothetical protein
MNIQDTKDTIKSAIILGGITNVLTYLPERPVPPCALIEPDAEYIRAHEDDYGPTYTSNWKIRVMAPTGTNETETTNLDSYLDTLIPTLWEHTDCATLSVAKPFITEANGANYLTTFISISLDMQEGE